MKENKELVQEDVLDLGLHRYGEINETMLHSFGSAIKTMIQWIFGENVFFPTTIKGTQSEVNNFLRTLSAEKNYMQSYKRYGLADQRTYNNKYELDRAVKNFEQETQLKWPFK